jgi:hypothetical protein
MLLLKRRKNGNVARWNILRCKIPVEVQVPQPHSNLYHLSSFSCPFGIVSSFGIMILPSVLIIIIIIIVSCNFSEIVGNELSHSY